MLKIEFKVSKLDETTGDNPQILQEQMMANLIIEGDRSLVELIYFHLKEEFPRKDIKIV